MNQGRVRGSRQHTDWVAHGTGRDPLSPSARECSENGRLLLRRSGGLLGSGVCAQRRALQGGTALLYRTAVQYSTVHIYWHRTAVPPAATTNVSLCIAIVSHSRIRIIECITSCIERVLRLTDALEGSRIDMCIRGRCCRRRADWLSLRQPST